MINISIPIETRDFKVYRDLSKVDTVIVHHSAHKSMSIKDIHEFHKTKFKARGIVYHYVIDFNGIIHQTRDLRDHTPHCKMNNKQSIGVCVLGDFTFFHPSAKITNSLYKLCEYLIDEYRITNIVPHHDRVTTICPGLLNISAYEVSKLLLNK